MSRLILVPHSGGLIDYKGEIRKLFIKTDHYQSGTRIFEYFGTSDELVWATYTPPPPVQEYRTRVLPGELIGLLDDDRGTPVKNYAKIFRAAYPQGNKPEDDTALTFLERAKFPTSLDGMIDVTDPVVDQALSDFVAAGYITNTDKTRVQLGIPL